MKSRSEEHGQNMFGPCLLMFCACSFHGNPTNNLLSYCGLVDARISASEKDLPVPIPNFIFTNILTNKIVLTINFTQNLF